METLTLLFIGSGIWLVFGELSNIKNAIKDNTKAIREKDQ